jgi:hypothetical protein
MWMAGGEVIFCGGRAETGKSMRRPLVACIG